MSRLPAGVAAHHPVTADAALEVLADGGTAADAAVAGILTSCVAETLLTSLLSGGHGIHYEAATGEVVLIDFFVAVPGLGRELPAESGPTVDIVFELEPVPYEIGTATAGVPGIAAGCELLNRRWGRVPWPRLVEPALRAARAGVALLPTHAAILPMLAAVFLLDGGDRLFAPRGELLVTGDVVRQPGLVHALSLLAEEGPRSCYAGTLAEDLLALCAERGGLIGRADLDAYEVALLQPAAVRYAGVEVRSRQGLSRFLPTLAALPDLAGLDEPARALALAAAIGGDHARGETTNLVAVDHDGNACAVTTSTGLGTGDYLHDVMLNSMLGERDLRTGPLIPGTRMESMMAPTVALDADGPVLVAGAAGGSRIPGALTQVVAGVLAEGRTTPAAIERPRLHRAGTVVSLEPDYDPDAEQALTAAGYTVRRFTTRHHFFGGVSAIGRDGPGADSRRDGAVRLLVPAAGPSGVQPASASPTASSTAADSTGSPP